MMLLRKARVLLPNIKGIYLDLTFCPDLTGRCDSGHGGVSRGEFCPIAGVLPYDDLEQVIDMSNETEYGLAAYVYGHNIHDIWRCMRGLEFGMVSVNSVKMTGGPIPFGGVKQSGLGREGSCHGFDEFSEIKYCCLGQLPTASGS